jgi:hypothetical protein
LYNKSTSDYERNLANNIGVGRRGEESTMGIRNFNLRRNEVRNMEKIGLNDGFSFFPLSLHHSNHSLENIYIFYLPLFNSVAKKCILK